MDTIEQCIPLIAAARQLNMAWSRWGIGAARNFYGPDLRLRAVVFDAKFLACQSIQDARRHDSWVKEGLPDQAQLVDVTLERSTSVGKTRIVFVCLHPTFDPVPLGEVIPTQPVEFVDMQAIPKVLSFLADPDTDAQF